MVITFTSDSERYIDDQVRRGRYGSADEVVSIALQLWADTEGRLADDVAQGTAQLEAGDAKAFDGDMLARIKRAGFKKLTGQ